MKFYIYSSIESDFKEGFLLQTQVRNFKITQIIAIISLAIGSLWRISAELLPFNEVFKDFDFYLLLNLGFTLFSLVCAVSFYLMRKFLPTIKLAQFHNLVWGFSLLFILKQIAYTFIAQRNPTNTLTMALIGFFIVSSILVFTIQEVIAIMVISFVVFIYGLGYFQTNSALWQINIIGFCILLAAFFVISRMLYSYHVDYYIKVKLIEAKNKEIEKVNASQNELLSLVAHDLRSPLSNIQSLAELMSAPDIVEIEKQSFLHLIKASCVKADLIIREIMSSAKDESESTLMRMQKENLSALLEESFTSWKKILNNTRKLNLILPKEPIYTAMNKDKMLRVLDNIINNAVKFTNDDSGEINIELTVNNNQILLIIGDNGIGVPQNMIPVLFDKYTKAGRDGLHDEPSIGLGLHISKRIIEKHGGNISVASQEGIGTSFNITLPIV